ncbi:epimerase [Orenia metallireducens]|uniref:Epimerase n=1 Tax=Orenia metallireducens TaxID=1413210 RepID=A0A1C0A8R8_9FIRM|nr:NAD-dependent epimerase/dehydratase family protein [Orenia metallireducens]OCL26610.1 epimerase [Orenia metallireducens]
MKILIMGGTQFVSSSIAKYMIDKGNKVDIFTRGKKAVNYDGIRNHIKANRKSATDLRDKLRGKSYDVVFDISAYTKEDVALLTSVLDRTKLKNYIFCSSGSVYEATEEVVKEDYSRGFNQNWGDYGLNKKKAEDYLFSLYEKEKFPITIFRPTYIYGEGNNLYRETYLFDRISEESILPIPAGNSKNQFVYIKDLVKTFESAMYSEKAIGNAYNLTHPEKVSWECLVETAMEVVGKEIGIKKVDYDDLGVNVRRFFPFRDVTYLLSIEKLEEDDLYIPKINLREGLRKAYNWYCEEKPEVEDPKISKIKFVLNS